MGSRTASAVSPTYCKDIEALLRSHANQEAAEAMSAYMRGLFPFLGIRTPERTSLTKQFMKANGVPSGEALERVVRELWATPEREFHYTAMILMEKRKKELRPEDASLLEFMVTTNSWWDTVDLIASHLVGTLFAKHPEMVAPYTKKWMDEADNLWLRRTAILFQLGYKSKTDVPLLFDLIRRTAHEEDFFIRKAIGWALREYGKSDAAAVKQFVAGTELSRLSVSEALKHIGS
ncbi:DNA alkylation repair protein [Paenibacillus sp. OV219]|uniref:DNA alkylation repair protein n=1 Tax=Paenibacillus sp. OV219 TaxID=1884377 RepID=UPI0008C76545|nr:DNA alkylation repair protein [Paenibacillus sp. OV219]SEN58435.1 DNA-7-methylguanine glycosylase [Paenibacillus sp. OV219]